MSLAASVLRGLRSSAALALLKTSPHSVLARFSLARRRYRFSLGPSQAHGVLDRRDGLLGLVHALEGEDQSIMGAGVGVLFFQCLPQVGNGLLKQPHG